MQERVRARKGGGEGDREPMPARTRASKILLLGAR